MNNTFDFSEFNRQSSKGIIIIFFKKAYQLFKAFWFVIPMILLNKTMPNYYIYIFLIVGLIALVIWSILSFLNFKFKIVDNHFMLKEGILTKKNVSIPFDKIQNINFKQNFIQQLIKTTQLEIETAGAKKVEISIKAIDTEKAKAIKSHIFKLKEQLNSDQDIDIQDDTSKHILFSVSLTELFKVSITENHLKSFLIVFTFITSLYFQAQEYFKDLNLEKDLKFDLENSFKSVTIVVIIVIIICALIAVFTSFFLIAIKHFNQTLSIKKDTLEIEQGLFTKKISVLKKEKVQFIVTETNPLKKRIGIRSIVFKQASSARVKASKLIKIVGCKLDYLNRVNDLLFKKIETQSFDTFKPHKYFIFKMCVRTLLFIGLINLLSILSKELVNFYLLNAILIGIVIPLIYLKYKRRFFKINDDMLIVGSGQISTKTTYFELFKTQTIKLSQTIFQKRRDIVDITLQTAAGKITLPCVNKNTAEKIYNYILYKTETTTQSWM
jgi:putative membrane protein